MKNQYGQQITDLLHELNIEYREDHHEPIFSVEVEIPELPGPQIKYLLVKPKKTEHEFYLILAHDEKHPDLKDLQAQLGTKRLTFPTSEEMSDLIGVEFGSLTATSVIADKNHEITVIVDEAIDRDDTIGIHPNDNSITYTIAFKDLERYLDHLGYTPRYIPLLDKE
ncbi:YbaK/EbsC family protein [Erysipelothrix rhusiopathiae]|uniref:YbaK/EbsC family protein n=1 Tax=Erysipelothrix rhusiopathiae TaxID=1648 RepID=UPI002B24B175|nr:YbaK/EbsC family protein [Erysipelothrix rhusiopathiae]WRB93619.1 YbaK/EbsC family protein [Erysipelothrix rhusiopathiae]